MTAVLDASALLALLRDEPGADEVEQALGLGASVSTVNWAEVLSKLADVGEEPDAVTASLMDGGILSEGLVIRPLDEAQAVRIAELRPITRSVGLSLADRACLALAGTLDLPALTADRVWAGLGLDLRVELIR